MAQSRSCIKWSEKDISWLGSRETICMSLTRYLIIDKKDDVYLKIEADEDIRRELGQFFTFEEPGFKFMPQFRNRVWDGKIRLFSYQTGQIYVGLYPYILKWCEDNAVQVVDGNKIQDTKVDEAKVDKFIKATT